MKISTIVETYLVGEYIGVWNAL